ncbi:MAG: AsmA family protein [bacterium]
MKKAFKILGIIFAIFIVLVIIAFILARVFITPERVRALLVDQLAKNLNREVEIQDLSVSIFKGISVDGFKVSESPAFKEGTFISSKKFLLRYKLLPLLKKQLSISTIVLEEPYLNIIRKPDGSFNFSDLLKPATAGKEKEPSIPEKKQPSKIAAFGLLVSKARLKDGEIDFVDYSAEDMSFKVHNLNLDVSGISPVSPIDISCSADLEQKKANGNIQFNGALDLDKDLLRIDELSPSYQDMSLIIKGQIENLREQPKLDITLQDRKISTEDISRIFSLPKDIELKGNFHFKTDISGPMDNMLIKTDADMGDISVRYGKTFEKKRGEKCGLKFEAVFKDSESLDLKQSSVYLQDYKISASGKVKGIKTQPLTIAATIQTKESDLKDLPGFLPALKDLNLSGRLGALIDISGTSAGKLNFTGEMDLDGINFILENNEIRSLKAQKIKFSNTNLNIPEMKGIWNEAEFSLSCKANEFTLQKFTSPNLSFDFKLSRLDINKVFLPLAPPQEEKKEGTPTPKPSQTSPMLDEIIKGIKVDGGLKIDQIIYRDFKLSNAVAKINMRQGRLEIKPLSLEGYEGKLSGDLQADLKQINDVKFETNIIIKDLDCNPAITDLHPQKMARIHGKASFEGKLSGKSSKIPDSLEGPGYLRIENGKIESTMPLLGEFMTILGKKQPEALFFSELKGHYKLKDKKIITNDLQMTGEDVSFDAQGWATLDGDLQFDLTARLNEKMIGKEARKYIVQDKEGRSLLFLIVKGNMNKPDIQPDIKKTVSDQAKQKIKDSVLEKALDEKNGELKKTIEKGLDQLFKFKK